MGITALYFLVLQTVAAQRDLNVAKELITTASTIAERNNERLFEVEFHRKKALTFLAECGARDVGQAEAELLTALEIARRQSARSLEIRVATSFARLWRDCGRRVQTHGLLAAVYGLFTESFDTPALWEAKSLLDELTA